MKKLIIILFIFLSSSLSFSQELQNISDHYYQLYQGQVLLEKGEADSACIIFEKAFKNVDYIHSRILIKKIIPAAKVARNKVLIKKYKLSLKNQKKCPKENIQILHLIDSIFKLDQKVRGKKYFKAQKFIQDHKDNPLVNKSKKYLKSKKLNEFHIAVDSLNILFMLKLTNQYGYIGEEIIGFNNHYKAQAIFLHFDKDTNNLMLGPILKKALLNYQITPLKYTTIIDRHRYKTSNTQKYWTWFMINADPKLTEKQIQTILKLREQIGLWNTEYKISNYKKSWMLNNLSRTSF